MFGFFRYVASVYTDQLLGSTSTSAIDDCDPLEKNGTRYLHPCGLIANTLFNDVITLESGGEMEETGIAWKSDIDSKVRNARLVEVRCRAIMSASPSTRPHLAEPELLGREA